MSLGTHRAGDVTHRAGDITHEHTEQVTSHTDHHRAGSASFAKGRTVHVSGFVNPETKPRVALALKAI